MFLSSANSICDWDNKFKNSSGYICRGYPGFLKPKIWNQAEDDVETFTFMILSLDHNKLKKQKIWGGIEKVWCVSFSQIGEAALSGRGFTATALPWGRPGVLKGKWNQQHYCPGSCCIPPPSPLELIKFSKGLVNIFSLNLRTALHSAVLSPLGNCGVVHSSCWGCHSFLPNKQHFLLHFIAISWTNMKGLQLLFRDTNYLQDDI